jgi:hypothetical protein
MGALLFAGSGVNYALDSVVAILGLGLTAVGILLPVIYSFRNEVKQDTATLRKEIKEVGKKLDTATDRLVEWRYEDRELVVTNFSFFKKYDTT